MKEGPLGYEKIYKDYFATHSTYNEALFRRRFRMRKNVFIKTMEDVHRHDPFFEQKRDALGLLGAHPLLKITAALRLLCYGMSADAIDENLRLSKTTTLTSLYRFCEAVSGIYEDQTLSSLFYNC